MDTLPLSLLTAPLTSQKRAISVRQNIAEAPGVTVVASFLQAISPSSPLLTNPYVHSHAVDSLYLLAIGKPYKTEVERGASQDL